MNPEKLGIEAEDFEVLEKDKFTQTDEGYLGSSLSAQSFGEIEKPDHGSVTVFEYCQIIQNPDHPRSVTIIKETVREETTSNPSNPFEEGTRYKYCKEILQPFVRYKPDYLECEDDDILQKALTLVEERPSPCLQTPDIEINKQIKDELLDNIVKTFSKVNAYTSFASMDKVRAADKKDDDYLPYCDEEVEEEPKGLPKCPPKTPPPEPEEQKCIPKCSPRDPDCPGQPPTCNPRDPDCLPPDERGCAQPQPPEPESEPAPRKKGKCGKKSSMSALEEGTPIILASTVVDNESSNNKQSDEAETIVLNENPTHTKTFTEAHNEAVTTIKVAMEDFIGKVYKSTQDAVTLIATESAKQLIKTKVSDIFNTDKTEDDESKSKRIFGIFSRESQESEGVGNNKYGPGAAAINNIVSKVDSAVTIISEKVTEKLDKFPDKLLQNRYNKSSPYDKPRPPSDVSHKFVPDPEPAHSVFSVIKSKIFSMFGDSEAKVENVLVGTESSPSSSEDDDDNEDIIERIID